VRKNCIFIVVITTALLYVTVSYLASCTGGKPIENKEQAINIAKAHVFKKYHNNFDEYIINARLDEDVWIVWYSYVDDSGYAVEDGGGPFLKIRQSNGRVLHCWLQQ
jgi:hypothetical protein